MSRHYLSCQHLEEGLVLQGNDLLHCCTNHSNNTKGFVKIGSMEDGFSIERILQSKADLIALNQTSLDTPCRGCPYLTKKDWKTNKSKYTISLLTINTWYACNLRCVYCYTITQPSEVESFQAKYNPLVLIQDLVEKGFLAPDAMISWGGGEVAAYKYFEPITRLLMDYGCIQEIHTNGTIYVNLIEEGLRRGKMYVTTSVDAGTSETYRRIKGRDYFDEVWNNLNRYAQAGAVNVKYIIYDQNNSTEDGLEFLRLSRKIGAKRILFVPETSEYLQHTISDKTIQTIATMMNKARKLGLRVTDNLDQHFGKKYSRKIEEKLDFIPLSSRIRKLFKSNPFLIKIFKMIRSNQTFSKILKYL